MPMKQEGKLQGLNYLSLDVATTDEVVLKRRKALEEFLEFPEKACDTYPDLKPGLLTFFSLCTNPYVDNSGRPEAGYHYELWQRAMEWARSQEPNLA